MPLTITIARRRTELTEITVDDTDDIARACAQALDEADADDGVWDRFAASGDTPSFVDAVADDQGARHKVPESAREAARSR